MSNQISEAQINAMVRGIIELGLPFTDSQIRSTLAKYKFNQENATNYLLELSMSNQGLPSQNQLQSTQSNPNPQTGSGSQGSSSQIAATQSSGQNAMHQAQSDGQMIDRNMSAAIQTSLKTEPLPLDKQMRSEGIPVGLKNIGNTCYFNSFIQAFFFLPNMTEKLLFNPIKRM